jgi:cardiolipin synthase
MWTSVVDFVWVFVWLLLTILVDFVAATMATVHIVLWKRDSRAAIAWVGLVWLAPLVGVFVYFCFGINRIQRKAISLRVRESWNPDVEPELTPEDVEHRDELTVRHPNLPGLASVGRSITGRPILPGNRIEPLINGDEAYPAMLDSINQAEHSVALLSYIFDSDRAGDAFFEALVRARDRGVEVRVLIDGVGARHSKPNMVRRLRSAGMRVSTFLPTRVPRLFKYANLRNHRKILVVDGKIGFTGGTNIREGHWLSLDPKSPVQCVHFRIEGPVVRQLQEVFAIDWAFASGESLGGDLWFPDIERSGPVWARGIPDGPDEDFEKMSDTILGALSAATSSVRVVSPYFLPDAALIRALGVTDLRGVDVRIYVPQKTNLLLMNWAMSDQLWQLLEKGCRIFYTPAPFDHTKLLVIDGVWALIGSTNWDARSLRLNFEFNVECYDEAFAAELNELIDQKAQKAREITLEEVDSRSFLVRMRDGLARLLTPYL